MIRYIIQLLLGATDFVIATTVQFSFPNVSFAQKYRVTCPAGRAFHRAGSICTLVPVKKYFVGSVPMQYHNLPRWASDAEIVKVGALSKFAPLRGERMVICGGVASFCRITLVKF